MPPKTRLDTWLTEHELAPSRQRAQALILSGNVYVNEKPARSAGQSVKEGDQIVVKGPDHPFVSRGGVKLAHALDSFELQIEDKVAIDIGASTGGFTDCLLKKGAARVYAVDVGYGQLDWGLRQDPRVVVIERTNVRNWQAEEVSEPVDVVTIDVSFISLKKVLPPLEKSLQKKCAPEVIWILLIKPQFEAGRADVGSGGVVRDVAVQQRVVREINGFVEERGWHVMGVIPSPIKGPKGNQEYLLVAHYTSSNH